MLYSGVEPDQLRLGYGGALGFTVRFSVERRTLRCLWSTSPSSTYFQRVNGARRG
jgi:hypothetical protein